MSPFPEMQGDIVFVDYGRSSWRYMSYERPYPEKDYHFLYVAEILGAYEKA